MKEEVKKEISRLLKLGIITPSHSPWSSPIVVVNKADGNIRFCFDYRQLNSVTRDDAFPLFRIEDIFARFQGKKYFSTLDMGMAYHPIGVSERD